MMTAHLVDLKRVTQAPERQKLISSNADMLSIAKVFTVR